MHGLSTGEISRDRHDRRIFRPPFLHRLGLCRRRMPARRTAAELLVPVLEAIATEAESLGLEVNWQKTTAQALGNIQDVPLSVTVLEQEVSTVEEFVYLGALIHSPTHQLTSFQTLWDGVLSRVQQCRALTSSSDQGRIQKFHLGARGAEGAEVERRRREDRGTASAEGCGEGVSPPHRRRGLGRGLCPLPEIFFFSILHYKMACFGRFWCTVDRCCQNGNVHVKCEMSMCRWSVTGTKTCTVIIINTAKYSAAFLFDSPFIWNV